MSAIESAMGPWARMMIDKFMNPRRALQLYETWSAEKDRYPFFSGFLRGTLYAAWFAAVEHNKKIDTNAHVDVELLCCLNRADAVVSHDQGFLRDALDI